MKHPTREEWMDFLYGESNRRVTAMMQRHLMQCAECSGQVSEWRLTQQRMDEWRVSSHTAPQPAFRHPQLISWNRGLAAAAAILVLGTCLGWMSRGWRSNQDWVALRSSIQAQFDKRFAAEQAALQATLVEELEALHQGTIDELAASVDGLERRNIARFTELRRDLDTVARTTAATFEAARERMAQLAILTQPADETLNPSPNVP